MGGVELLEIVIAGAFGTFRFDLHKLFFDFICLMDFSHTFLFHFESLFLPTGMGEVVRINGGRSGRDIDSFLLYFIPSLLPSTSFSQ